MDHIFEEGDWFIAKASYCGECTNDKPCEKCLDMCNRYVISGKHRTTNGWDYFFGGHWTAERNSCMLTIPTCYVLTTDKNKVDTIGGITHISAALPIKTHKP